jgi:hypothetical protein
VQKSWRSLARAIQAEVRITNGSRSHFFLIVMLNVGQRGRYHLESCVVEERERFCWYGKSILSHRGTSRELSVIVVADARGLV